MNVCFIFLSLFCNGSMYILRIRMGYNDVLQYQKNLSVVVAVFGFFSLVCCSYSQLVVACLFIWISEQKKKNNIMELVRG